jgi:hypothetical protein
MLSSSLSFARGIASFNVIDSQLDIGFCFKVVRHFGVYGRICTSEKLFSKG